MQTTAELCRKEAMYMVVPKSKRIWTVAEAQANLPKVLRLAEPEGPKYIGGGKIFVVTPAEPEQSRTAPCKAPEPMAG